MRPLVGQALGDVVWQRRSVQDRLSVPDGNVSPAAGVTSAEEIATGVRDGSGALRRVWVVTSGKRARRLLRRRDPFPEGSGGNSTCSFQRYAERGRHCRFSFLVLCRTLDVDVHVLRVHSVLVLTDVTVLTDNVPLTTCRSVTWPFSGNSVKKQTCVLPDGNITTVCAKRALPCSSQQSHVLPDGNIFNVCAEGLCCPALHEERSVKEQTFVLPNGNFITVCAQCLALLSTRKVPSRCRPTNIDTVDSSDTGCLPQFSVRALL